MRPPRSPGSRPTSVMRRPMTLRLSVLDQTPIPDGTTGAQALANTIDLARHADELGYHRYWVSEHHGGLSLAGPAPESLIPAIASVTSRLRVGSGGVMLPHYSPLKVAEQFSLLAGLFPGRIDLGIGRASGTDPLTQYALQRDRSTPLQHDDFLPQLSELLGYLEGSLPADHAFARLARSLPGLPESPEPWLLGSSLQSAIWAPNSACRTPSPTSSTPAAPRWRSTTPATSSLAAGSRPRRSPSRRGCWPPTPTRRPTTSR